MTTLCMQWLPQRHNCIWLLGRFIPWSRSGELRMQKLKSYLVRTQSLNVLPLKPGEGQHIAIHAMLIARDFFLPYFYPSGPFTCIFRKPLLISPVLAVANTWLCWGVKPYISSMRDPRLNPTGRHLHYSCISFITFPVQNPSHCRRHWRWHLWKTWAVLLFHLLKSRWSYHVVCR